MSTSAALTTEEKREKVQVTVFKGQRNKIGMRREERQFASVVAEMFQEATIQIDNDRGSGKSLDFLRIYLI